MNPQPGTNLAGDNVFGQHETEQGDNLSQSPYSENVQQQLDIQTVQLSKTSLLHDAVNTITGPSELPTDINVAPTQYINPIPSLPQQPVNTAQNITIPQIIPAPTIQPLLSDMNDDKGSISSASMIVPDAAQKLDQKSQQASPQKSMITKVKLVDEYNILDWFKTTDIINQIAERAKHSVDSVITALDPGMREYLYSGGNINIMVISDSSTIVSPIRDSFQCVFGRATVVAARYNPPQLVDDYPVKLACGFNQAIVVAQERIKKLRLDTGNVPQNQAVVAIQPSLVSFMDGETIGESKMSPKFDESLIPKWFLTYCILLEDPVLNATMYSYSQFIPIDTELVAVAREAKFSDSFDGKHLGFSISIDDLMNSKLKLAGEEIQNRMWLQLWAGLDESLIMQSLSTTLAHLYRRKWNELNCSTS